MRLYVEVARRAFQQQLAYRAAAIAGIITNAGFGCFKALIFIALYRSQNGQSVGGYDLRDALTFVWFTQGMITVIAIWGWYDIAQTITTGAVATDLSRPYDYFTFWYARDLGRAACLMLVRWVPSFLIGVVLFQVWFPTNPAQLALFTVSLVLAVTVSFALRFLVNLGAFWWLDFRGIAGLWNLLVTLLSGFELPLVYFPNGLRAVCDVLPFRGMIQTPADIFLGKATGGDALALIARQAMWAVVLMVGAQLMTRVATRKVVVQGG